MPTWATSAACRSAWRGSRSPCPPSCSTTSARARSSSPIPRPVDHPFYQLAPDWAGYPLVALATVATVIASQAIISGVFSLTQQAVQLGFLPRMHIRHTASHEIGQIYVPLANWLLAAATLGAVVGFGTLGRARRRLRHRRVAPDGDHHPAGRPRRHPVGLVAADRDRGERLLLRHRSASSSPPTRPSSSRAAGFRCCWPP